MTKNTTVDNWYTKRELVTIIYVCLHKRIRRINSGR